MEKLAKNKIVLVIVVIIVGVGLVAAYVPLLFIPSAYEEQSQIENRGVEPIVEASSTPVVPTATSSEQLPDPFSGIQGEQESLDDLGNLLNQ